MRDVYMYVDYFTDGRSLSNNPDLRRTIYAIPSFVCISKDTTYISFTHILLQIRFASFRLLSHAVESKSRELVHA